MLLLHKATERLRRGTHLRNMTPNDGFFRPARRRCVLQLIPTATTEASPRC